MTGRTRLEMDVLNDRSFAALLRFVTLIILSFQPVLATVLAQPSANVSSPSPWPYYLQVYPAPEEAAVTPPLKSLYFALMMSFGGDFESDGTIPGVQVALDQINRDPTLLPGYQLHYTLTDSQCNRTVALNAFFKQIVQDPVKISWIGSGCSIATEPTAEISHYYNITQLSCASASHELADRQRFRYYFQMLTTEANLAQGFFSIIKQFGWKKVAFIEQNENLFTVTMDRLRTLLMQAEISFTRNTFNTEDSIEGLGQEPFDPQARIFIIATYSGHARRLLCKAYRLGMRYPRYMFLTYGWYVDGWWEGEDGEDGCTPVQRKSVLPYTLAPTQDEFLTNFSATTDTGINGYEYNATYSNHRDSSILDLDRNRTNFYAQHCYDATWALAFALNRTITELEENSTLNAEVWEAAGLQCNGTFPLEQFSYNNRVLLDVIFRHVKETSFSGITGHVSFGSIGIRESSKLQIYQYRDHEERFGLVKIGVATQDHLIDYLPGEEENLWPGGLIPYDGIPLEQEVSVAIPVTVIFSILATAGIIFTVVCLVFNCTFRNRKLIRLSSHNLNYLIGCGAIILYVDIYFFIIPTTNPQVVAALCNVTPWLTALGYSLCYGTILAKMARVYFIFNNSKLKKFEYPLQDRFLTLGVLMLMLVDVIIIVVYTIVEGVQGNLIAIRIPNRENPSDEEGVLGITTLYFTYICSSRSRDIFLGVLFGYKMVLQIIAILLAFSTRKVKVKGLDDAKYIAAATYVTSIAWAVTIVSIYSLKEFVNGFVGVFCTGLLIGTTFILGLIFVPKMVSLYKDPQGNTIFERADAAVTKCTTSNSLDNIYEDSFSRNRETVDSLRRRIMELESTLSQKQTQL